jgi:hypothetical protein
MKLTVIALVACASLVSGLYYQVSDSVEAKVDELFMLIERNREMDSQMKNFILQHLNKDCILNKIEDHQLKSHLATTKGLKESVRSGEFTYPFIMTNLAISCLNQLDDILRLSFDIANAAIKFGAAFESQHNVTNLLSRQQMTCRVNYAVQRKLFEPTSDSSFKGFIDEECGHQIEAELDFLTENLQISDSLQSDECAQLEFYKLAEIAIYKYGVQMFFGIPGSQMDEKREDFTREMMEQLDEILMCYTPV